jgi:hypothetical protein
MAICYLALVITLFIFITMFCVLKVFYGIFSYISMTVGIFHIILSIPHNIVMDLKHALVRLLLMCENKCVLLMSSLALYFSLMYSLVIKV